MSKDKGTKNTKKTAAPKSADNKKQSAYKSESNTTANKTTLIDLSIKKPKK